jgi:hypothetical protein
MTALFLNLLKMWIILEVNIHKSYFGSHPTSNKHKTKKKLNSVAFSPQAKYTDRPIDRRLSAKLVPTFADIGCRVVSATDLPDR